MTLEVETVVAVSLMMAVFSAVAAIGTSLVLGAGFERLRSGFEVVRKQTGFFSEAIHKLEQKVETVDQHEQVIGQKLHEHANVDLISTAKTEALVSHAENLLTQMSVLAGEMQSQKLQQDNVQNQTQLDLSIPKNLMHFIHKSDAEEGQHSFH